MRKMEINTQYFNMKNLQRKKEKKNKTKTKKRYYNFSKI